MTTTTVSLASARSGLGACILAVTLGVALLTISGMAQATVLHDAAHDQRHAMAFPCH
jgi:cobalt transporter subunit CbtB